MKKEGQLNRDQQPLPLRVSQPKVRQINDASRRSTVSGLALTNEQDRACPADTDQSPPLRLNQVLVDFAQFGAAEIAALDRLSGGRQSAERDRKSTRLNSSHLGISYAVFCLKKKKKAKMNSCV